MNDLCDRRLSSKMMLILMVVIIMVIKYQAVGVRRKIEQKNLQKRLKGRLKGFIFDSMCLLKIKSST